MDKIEQKVTKWVRKHTDEIDDMELDQNDFRQLMLNVLGAYS